MHLLAGEENSQTTAFQKKVPWYQRWWFRAEVALLITAILSYLLLLSENFFPTGTVYVWWLYNFLFILCGCTSATQVLVLAAMLAIVIYKIWMLSVLRKRFSEGWKIIGDGIYLLISSVYAAIACVVTGLLLLLSFGELYESVPEHVREHEMYRVCDDVGMYCQWDLAFLGDPSETFTKVYRTHGVLMTYIETLPSLDVYRSMAK
ncbi:hypothetical protein [Arcanobacterium hippocoleae]|uniref:Transmembrane protein n=1 Tax=Arcanobacterium hippocoleae TaxID=149017 RepID=A0ABU1T3E7_9ACTO|nr:hypothetical protein [Arcanobacterium hippocoleae]MDR6939906.1 hypothetical protein [Arcanobacterium hippocoleae]